ncbi:unnamed protein product [Prorocentrum cordatum]|uniref:Uncharacterized protein n=1 Tax=Prorocentrum cordatum TaxID=2364126 RepID=A0ABN9WIE7_9DINO|nr:unnamed protein product [Polarella glacialis]
MDEELRVASYPTWWSTKELGAALLLSLAQKLGPLTLGQICSNAPPCEEQYCSHAAWITLSSESERTRWLSRLWTCRSLALSVPLP